MKNSTFLHILAICFVVLAFVGVNANAAVTSPQIGVAKAGATADLISTAYIPVSSKIVSVKVNPQTGGKYYRLRAGSATGAIIYETNSAATTATLAADRVSFRMPGSGLYFQTDDSGPLKSIIIYSE